MTVYTFLRYKTLKVILILITFGILCLILLTDEMFISKLKCNRKICAISNAVPGLNTSQNSFPLHFTVTFKTEKSEVKAIDILFLFSHAEENSDLKHKFKTCLTSLFIHTSSPLHLHVITDKSSYQSALKTIQESSVESKSHVEVSLYDVISMTTPLKSSIASMQLHFSYKLGAYYSDALFYISTGLFKVLPAEKVIMLDVDIKFLDDIQNLYDHFNKFQNSAIIGIAREQQPVYRHILHSYRLLYNDTKAGEPPPKGLSGFNSGVLLLDLIKMQHSDLYAQLLNSSTITSLVEKYKFKGHLGDQDFYSLISFEHEELFYVLPCGWNRQLCQWWKRHGYKEIFDQYYACSGKIKLLHGNCNTFIPN